MLNLSEGVLTMPDLLRSLIHWIKTWWPRRESFSEIVREYDLEGRVGLHELRSPPRLTITLFRIIESEEEGNEPLPSTLVAAVELFVRSHYAKTTPQGHSLEFVVGPARTLESIRDYQRAWADAMDGLV